MVRVAEEAGASGENERKRNHGRLERKRRDINCVDMFITLADFDCRWCV